MRVKNLILLSACLSGGIVVTAPAETYTMDAYYPSPAGVYRTVTVTSTTVLARDGGNVNIGTSARPAELSVEGNAKVSGVVVPGRSTSDPAAPEQQVEGAIYFNTSSKRYRIYKVQVPASGRSSRYATVQGGWTDLGAITVYRDIPYNDGDTLCCPSGLIAGFGATTTGGENVNTEILRGGSCIFVKEGDNLGQKGKAWLSCSADVISLTGLPAVQTGSGRR